MMSLKIHTLKIWVLKYSSLNTYYLERELSAVYLLIPLMIEEITNTINKDNDKLKVFNASRLKRRDSSGPWIDFQTVCLKFKGQILSNSILIWRSKIFVSPYVPAARLCFKCGRMGHITKCCQGKERCLTCSNDHISSKDSPCDATNKCINCSRIHYTKNRNFPLVEGTPLLYWGYK